MFACACVCACVRVRYATGKHEYTKPTDVPTDKGEYATQHRSTLACDSMHTDRVLRCTQEDSGYSQSVMVGGWKLHASASAARSLQSTPAYATVLCGRGRYALLEMDAYGADGADSAHALSTHAPLRNRSVRHGPSNRPHREYAEHPRLRRGSRARCL